MIDNVLSWLKLSKKPNCLNDIFHQKLKVLAITWNEKDVSSPKVSNHSIPNVSHFILHISPYWIDTMPAIYFYHFIYLSQSSVDSPLPIYWFIEVVNSFWAYIICLFFLNNQILILYPLFSNVESLIDCEIEIFFRCNLEKKFWNHFLIACHQ